MYTLMICFEDMIVKLSDKCNSFTCVCEVKMGKNGLEVGLVKDFEIVLSDVDLSWYDMYKNYYKDKCEDILKHLYRYELQNGEDMKIYVFGIGVKD